MLDWFIVASYIILVPIIIAFINYKYIDSAFVPLLINLCIGVIAEILGHIFRVVYHNNLYVINVFVLFDFLTLFWLFDNWGAFRKISKGYKLISVVSFVLLWGYDNLWVHHLSESTFVFRVAYYLFLVLIAINQLINIILKNSSVKHNPFLYVCLGIIFYYSYSIFISLFLSPSLFNVSQPLWINIWVIYALFNIFLNLMFAIAFIWIRKKERFI